MSFGSFLQKLALKKNKSIQQDIYVALYTNTNDTLVLHSYLQLDVTSFSGKLKFSRTLNKEQIESIRNTNKICFFNGTYPIEFILT